MGCAQQVEFIMKMTILASGIGDLAFNHSPQGKKSKHGMRFHLGFLRQSLGSGSGGRGQTSTSTVGRRPRTEEGQ